MIASIAILGLLSACGGGGESTPQTQAPTSSAPAMTLNWNPPTAYTDSTPLNPTADLEFFEIYVKQDGNFTPSDPVTAEVSAVDPVTKASITSFDLRLLAPHLSQSIPYFVSVRAVSMSGVKSDFSPSASFSL